MKTWELKLKISIADSWIADGFDLSKRLPELQEAIQDMIPSAYDHEIVVESKILSAPTKETIEALQDGTIEIED